jgi:hypothetical protein
VVSIPIPDFETVVKVLGGTFCVLGILACLRLIVFAARRRDTARPVQLGFVALGPRAFYKILAFVALLILPAAGLAMANYHVFEGTHETKACLSCHVMRPMGNDMFSPESPTLAARHTRNGWVSRENGCYECHADYGLAGNLEAKMDGFRHLARYTSGTYNEPIRYRGTYNNGNCLNCHQGTRAFETVQSHHTAGDFLAVNAMSCLNCHGKAHPTRDQRTPGHPDYASLMEPVRP